MTQDRLGAALKVAGVVLAGCLSLAALAAALALTTRTTAVATGDWPAVYRENLLTGRGRFCLPDRAGGVVCVSKVATAPAGPALNPSAQ